MELKEITFASNEEMKKTSLTVQSPEQESCMTIFETERYRFAANLVHDLRGPISAIRITAGVLYRQIEQSHNLVNPLEVVGHIVKASNQLYRMLDNMLVVSQESDSEKMITSFSLTQLIVDVLEIVTLSAEIKNLNIHADLSHDIEVTADKYRCFRVLLNLVENAIKYTQKGDIWIRATYEAGQIIVEVKDSGIGISREQQMAIFQCYTQLNAGRLPREGIGLGLHLVLLFAEQMGGKVTVQSEPNAGATFVFSFPSPVPLSPVLAASYEASCM